MKLFNLTLLLLIVAIKSEKIKVSSSNQATLRLKHEINQCEDGTHDCVSPQICENLVGAHAGYRCSCPSGYVPNTALQKSSPALHHTIIYDPCHDKTAGDACTLCDPADTSCAESTVMKQCDSDGVCQTNTVVLAPSPAPETSACLDIDECIEKTDSCTSSQTCQNTVGSFTCIDDEPEPESTSEYTWTTFMVYLLGGIFLLLLLIWLVLTCLGMSF